MARRFITQLPEPGEAWRFAEIGAGSITLCAPHDRPGRSDDVTVIVPGTEVAIAPVRLVGARRADWLRAARFAVEDDLSVPVETLHVAAEAQARAGAVAEVCLVSRSVMEGWMAQLADAGLNDARIVPDTSLLPVNSAPLDIGPRILVAGEGGRFAIDTSLPAELVSALLAKAGAAPESAGDPLLALAGLAAVQPGIDLRQADYARKSDEALDFSRVRLLAGLAAACALTWGTYTFASIQTMQRLEGALERQTRASFTALYPGEPVPTNILAAVRDRSGAAAPVTAGFRQMAAVLYGALGTAEGISLSSLRYNSEDGRLQATLVYTAFGDDAALKTEIEARGLAVRLGDTRVDNGRVVGDMILELSS